MAVMASLSHKRSAEESGRSASGACHPKAGATQKPRTPAIILGRGIGVGIRFGFGEGVAVP